MPYFPHDLTDWVSKEVDKSREDVRRQLRRVKALRELKVLCVDASHAQQRPVELEDLFRVAKNEAERERVRALCRVIAGIE